MKARAPAILLTLLASFLVPIMIGNVYASGCMTACQVNVNSNVPSSDGTIWIEIDNNTSTANTGNYCGSHICIVSLPAGSPPTLNFGNNTVQTIMVLNSTFTGSSTQGHYVWKEWDNYYGTSYQTKWTTSNTLVLSSVIYNYTGAAGFTAVFDKQYQYTFSFSDVNRNPLSPAPASLTLQAQGSSSTTTITGYSGYLSASLYTIVSANWEGTTVGTTSSQTFDLSNAGNTATISLKAYPVTVAIVDNNNNPVQGANVTITFVNSTSRSYISNSKGLVNLGDIPSGSFGATVHYQNQAYGPYSLTAVNSPTNTLQVNSGTTTTSTTTAIVLLAIFGIAFFLILLAIKVRKPAPPPRI